MPGLRRARESKMRARSSAAVQLLRRSMKTGSSMPILLVAALRRPPVRCR
jgi:hypothetical protein